MYLKCLLFWNCPLFFRPKIPLNTIWLHLSLWVVCVLLGPWHGMWMTMFKWALMHFKINTLHSEFGKSRLYFLSLLLEEVFSLRKNVGGSQRQGPQESPHSLALSFSFACDVCFPRANKSRGAAVEAPQASEWVWGSAHFELPFCGPALMFTMRRPEERL